MIDDGWLEVARTLWEGGQGTEDVRKILEWVSSRTPRDGEKLAPLPPGDGGFGSRGRCPVSARDSFAVYLRDLPAREIDYRVVDDGRHVFNVTIDVGLYVRPETDDLPAVIAGLEKLASTASEMAEALSRELTGVPPTGPMCAAEVPNGSHGGMFTCTLGAAHEGRHKAHGASPLPVWDDGDTTADYDGEMPGGAS